MQHENGLDRAQLTDLYNVFVLACIVLKTGLMTAMKTMNLFFFFKSMALETDERKIHDTFEVVKL